MIHIGPYIEAAIEWLTDHFAPFFDVLNIGIGGFISGFQEILFAVPFYITISLFVLLAWFKSGKGTSIFLHDTSRRRAARGCSGFRNEAKRMGFVGGVSFG